MWLVGDLGVGTVVFMCITYFLWVVFLSVRLTRRRFVGCMRSVTWLWVMVVYGAIISRGLMSWLIY